VLLQEATFGFLLERLPAQVPQLAVSKWLLAREPTAVTVLVVTSTFAVARRPALTAQELEATS
jgi:hypothetical protein